MDTKLKINLTLLLLMCVAITAFTIDPNYLQKAKIQSSEEVEGSGQDNFEPSAVKCGRIGEQAASKRISCIADRHFYETLSNRVHMLTIGNKQHDQELLHLSSKISRCSYNFSKYFERSCKMKSVHLNDRMRCRRLPTQQARTVCKGNIQRRQMSPIPSDDI